MTYLFLIALIAGLLLGVRLMFFGAERRRLGTSSELPLRRWEPAVVGFLVMFGIAGYLLARHGAMRAGAGTATALLLGMAWAGVVTRVAIATARVQPEHDPEDPRFILQGHVAVVTAAIPAGGEGAIAIQEGSQSRSLRARTIDESGAAAGQEVCIERVDDDVAYVEPWAAVEARL
jgi:membrane protein implicated in regulation of membrane protease activity